MAKEAVKIIQRRFVNRMLESGLLILAVALGVGAAASGLSLLLHTNQYSEDMLSSTSYRELVITTKDKSEDMETPLVEKNTGDEVILTAADLTAAEIVPQVSFAYIANKTRMRFLNQEMINRIGQDGGAGGGPGDPPPDGESQPGDAPPDRNGDDRFTEMQKNIEDAASNPDVIIPEIDELSGYEITPQYFDARHLTAEYGSLFTERDMSSMTDFVVLGNNTAELLAVEGSELSTLIGKKILSFNSYFTIIGILEETGTIADDSFFRPDSGSSGGGFGPNNSGANRQLRFTVSDPSELDEAAVLLTTWFETSYGEEKFVLSNPRAEAERLMNRNRGISLLILFLSLAGLFIASVNISHILMSRTLRMKKHVGILKALGASNKDVLKLFAGEALLITFIGAVIGTIIAFPLSNAMESAMGLDQGSWLFIMTGVIFSSLLTFAFSIIPSFQNSGFEAAEAMRTAG
ncbi:MAG: ABC transporter permease [Spirochaetaceae bacterium]|jgi:ABC-type antimicrobial peptide transport system permease subunit|nr:ABC transporter permease [Spirochaetaceae bacterium]